MKAKNIVIYIMCVVVLLLGVISIRLYERVRTNFSDVVINMDKEVILFTGDSLTDRYNLSKFYSYQGRLIINSGISGYKTTNVISRHRNMIEQYQPDKMFLLIGINDLNKGASDDEVIENIETIIVMTQGRSPKTKIYIESIYPVNTEIRKSGFKDNDTIKAVNKRIKRLCETYNCEYIDMYDELIDSKNNLIKEYTDDGLHVNDKGYEVITSILKKYIEA